jgi:hypothetical protein
MSDTDEWRYPMQRVDAATDALRVAHRDEMAEDIYVEVDDMSPSLLGFEEGDDPRWAEGYEIGYGDAVTEVRGLLRRLAPGAFRD